MARSTSHLLAAGLLLVAGAGQAQTLHKLAKVPGAQPGATVAVVLPQTAYTRTTTLADQLTRWQLPQGTLVVYTHDGGEENGEAVLDAALAIPADARVVVTQDFDDGDDKEFKRRLPLVHASDPAKATAWMTAAIAETFTDDAPAVEVVDMEQDGLLWLRFSDDDTPESRQHRWTRLAMLGMLADAGMAPSAESVLAAMPGSDFAFALYDCEGVGDSGPRMLQRIFRDSGIPMTVTPVTGEDIREGVLSAGFAGVLFPGGSGKSIATGLRENGQENVRQFVSAGGGYVGICAGSYLASCRIDGYLEMAGAYHGQPWAKGSAMLELELTPEGEAILGSEFKQFTTRYNNGPVFAHEDGLVPEGEFAPMQTLAVFKTPATRKDGTVSEEMVGEAAIAITTYGDGRLMLISPHPESHEELNTLVKRALLWAVKGEQREAAQQTADAARP